MSSHMEIGSECLSSLAPFLSSRRRSGGYIGGMLLQGYSTADAVRHGTVRGDLKLDLNIASIVKTRKCARKSSAGFNLTKHFNEAEGILGIITEGMPVSLVFREPLLIPVPATLRFMPRTLASVAVASFPDIPTACLLAIFTLNFGAAIGTYLLDFLSCCL